MAAAQWINQKQQRHALEQRVCLQLGPQQQVAYVDCASHHETLMKSTVEQPPTTTDTPREATFESAVFGAHEDLHLTMRLSQCFKHSTHQVKIVHLWVLTEGWRWLCVPSSLAAPQRHCRGVKGVSPEKCCGITLAPGIQVKMPSVLHRKGRLQPEGRQQHWWVARRAFNGSFLLVCCMCHVKRTRSACVSQKP